MPAAPDDSKKRPPKQHPFRSAVLRGLGILMPPLLTIVLFIWAWSTIDAYVLRPLEMAARGMIVWSIYDVKDDIPNDLAPVNILLEQDGKFVTANQVFGDEMPPPSRLPGAARGRGAAVVSFRDNNQVYVPIPHGKWIPETVYTTVRDHPGELQLSSATPRAIYRQYVNVQYLKRLYVIPIFLMVFISVLFLFGKFLAAGIGRMAWNSAEGIIHRIPVIRNVYSSVKQVTDFVFSEREIEFNRVVAVQYPRVGLWSVGFVTGESMLDIRSAANEPVLSVLMPTSPMPATGFTITVRKSETIDLNLTVDQAIQFIVSCGVVVPAQQQGGQLQGTLGLPPGVVQEPVSSEESDSRATGVAGRLESSDQEQSAADPATGPVADDIPGGSKPVGGDGSSAGQASPAGTAASTPDNENGAPREPADEDGMGQPHGRQRRLWKGRRKKTTSEPDSESPPPASDEP